MIDIIILLVTILYFIVGVLLLKDAQYAKSVVFISYGVANVGILLI